MRTVKLCPEKVERENADAKPATCLKVAGTVYASLRCCDWGSTGLENLQAGGIVWQLLHYVFLAVTYYFKIIIFKKYDSSF